MSTATPYMDTFSLQLRIHTKITPTNLQRTKTINKVYTELVVKFIMAFGSPESAGIPRLAHIVLTVKGNP